jgi:hypothetical protein
MGWAEMAIEHAEQCLEKICDLKQSLLAAWAQLL